MCIRDSAGGAHSTQRRGPGEPAHDRHVRHVEQYLQQVGQGQRLSLIHIFGVVVCPITSGDTAFRSARLTLADWFKIDQDSYVN